MEGLPVVAFRFSDALQQQYPEIQQKWIQTLLRAKGWIVPNYELPPDLENVQILRVVVRENLAEPLVDRLFADIVEITQNLIDRNSSVHALEVLEKQHIVRTDHEVLGKMEEGSGSRPSGTYAKQC